MSSWSTYSRLDHEGPAQSGANFLTRVKFEPAISLYQFAHHNLRSEAWVFMTGNDCRKRAEEARQQATRVNHRDRDIWLQIADKYDRLASELDWLDTRALKKERPTQSAASTNAEKIS